MRARLFLGLSLLLNMLVALSACGAPSTGGPAITVQEPWVRPAAMMAMEAEPTPAATMAMEMEATPAAEGMAHGGGALVTSAAYMTLVNNGGQADALVAVASAVADTVELHTVEMVNNVMQMRPVTEIELPAGGTAELKPGGFHVMLIGVNRDLKVGDEVQLTLTFRNAGPVEVTAQVRQP